MAGSPTEESRGGDSWTQPTVTPTAGSRCPSPLLTGPGKVNAVGVRCTVDEVLDVLQVL
jgi:hypothetical protein